jgi:hypothetical protein
MKICDLIYCSLPGFVRMCFFSSFLFFLCGYDLFGISYISCNFMSYGVLDAKLWDRLQRLTVSLVLILVNILLATNLIY